MPAKELREADDNQPKIFELVVGKKKGEQMFQFSIQKRLSVLVRTEDELNWEEARARCQQLGDELDWTESGLNGDLYHFMTEYVHIASTKKGVGINIPVTDLYYRGRLISHAYGCSLIS